VNHKEWRQEILTYLNITYHPAPEETFILQNSLKQTESKRN